MQLLPSRVLLLPIMLCHKSNRCTHSTDADISNETYCVVLLFATLVHPVKNHHEYKNKTYLNELNLKMVIL